MNKRKIVIKENCFSNDILNPKIEHAKMRKEWSAGDREVKYDENTVIAGGYAEVNGMRYPPLKRKLISKVNTILK